jgi:ElaB/YqjD/DUF883 family membrane-anchored ribosome-binding protein
MFSRKKEVGLATVKEDFNKLVADVRTLMSAKELDSIPEIRALRSQIEDGISSTRESASRVVSNARDTAVAADEYAREEPWKIAAAALAVGVIVGAFACRK